MEESYRVVSSGASTECFRCGVCCSRYCPRVTLGEIEHIAQALGISARIFVMEYVRRGPEKDSYILRGNENKCPFLSWDNTTLQAVCTIYSFRPLACHNWIASSLCSECREGQYYLLDLISYRQSSS